MTSTPFQILDVNEVPTDIILSTLKVKENLDPDTQLAILTTSDPDSNQVFVYSSTETGKWGTMWKTNLHVTSDLPGKN